MKRLFSIALLSSFIFAALSFAACSGTEPEVSAPSAAPTAEPTSAPTEAPSSEPTAAPTPEPTPVPKLYFVDNEDWNGPAFPRPNTERGMLKLDLYLSDALFDHEYDGYLFVADLAVLGSKQTVREELARSLEEVSCEPILASYLEERTVWIEERKANPTEEDLAAVSSLSQEDETEYYDSLFDEYWHGCHGEEECASLDDALSRYNELSERIDRLKEGGCDPRADELYAAEIERLSELGIIFIDTYPYKLVNFNLALIPVELLRCFPMDPRFCYMVSLFPEKVKDETPGFKEVLERAGF